MQFFKNCCIIKSVKSRIYKGKTRNPYARVREKRKNGMYHIIVNPVSGKKKVDKSLETVQRVLTERGAEFILHRTEKKGDGERIALELTVCGEEEIIVMGGDGTLHEVLNGLNDPSKCKLGLIPCGTGNDFAQHVGLPLDAAKAIERILDGEAKPIDYIDVGGRRSMNVAGLGMDVDVLERCEKGKIRGKIKYLMSLLKSLFAFKGYEIETECEGEVRKHGVLIAAVCNGSTFGGGIRICPTAKANDGKMDVVVVDCIPQKRAIIKAFFELMKGRILPYPKTTHYLCEQVRFTPAKPCTVQLDGELYKELVFDAKICKGLKFYQ